MVLLSGHANPTFRLKANDKCQHHLHCFNEESSNAISAIIYLTSQSPTGERTTSFVLRKSRVTQIEQISIPKKKFETAVMGAKLAGIVRRELQLNIAEWTFWSDKTATLGWIIFPSCQKEYNVNWVATFLDNSNHSEGQHIAGKQHSARYRGLKTQADLHPINLHQVAKTWSL